ncbi:MAG: hypothetical protein PHQ72_14360 [Hespellia sp.]|nr:hypothetical protein [Hespellia sp.]
MDRKRQWMIKVMMIMAAACVLSLSLKLVPHAESAEGEEKPEISLYELQYDQPNGENGFYCTRPMVKLVHHDENTVTKYELKASGAVLTNGCLGNVDENIVIPTEYFREGRVCLDVWMEAPHIVDAPEPEPDNPEGDNPEPDKTEEDVVESEPDNPEIVWKEVPSTRQTITFLIDTQAPTISMEAPDGFDAWYLDDVTIRTSVSDGDGISGLMSMKSFLNGQETENVDLAILEGTNTYSENTMVRGSSENGNPIEVLIEVKDRAGNQSSMTRKLSVDRMPPQISWEGISDYLISGKPLEFSGIVSDENGIAAKKMQIHFQGTDGNETETENADWQSRDNQQTAANYWEADGIYEVQIKARDLAGREAEQSIHVTIDQTSPVIRYVEQLNGSYLPYFEWNYEAKDMVEDFSTYEYQMKVDGMLYQPKERIMGEGMHLFQVLAVDAAGNQNEMQAGFVIDHTKPEIRFGNVRDGEAYTESVEAEISARDPQDSIQRIAINGEKQKINTSSRFYLFPFQEPGVYEISVSAVDLAGNKTQQNISFQVEAKKGVTKVLEKFGIVRGKTDKVKEPEKTDEEKLKLYQKAIMLGVVILISGLAGLQIYQNLIRDNKKTPHKREDAK